LPEITTNKKVKNIEEEKDIDKVRANQTTYKVNKRFWRTMLTELLPIHCIGILAKCSASPDMILTFANGIVGIALKLYSSSSKHQLTGSSVKEEIAKFQDIFDNYNDNKYQNRLLLFVAPVVGPSLSKISGKLLKSGVYNNVTWKKGNINKKLPIQVPIQMEALIADDQCLIELFTQDGLNLLKSIADKKHENYSIINGIINISLMNIQGNNQKL